MGVPLTVAAFCFGLSLLAIYKTAGKLRLLPPLLKLIYLLFIVLLLTVAATNLKTATPKEIALVVLLIMSPLAIIISSREKNPERVLRITAAALLITGSYAILQWLFGLHETTIPGVNLALGDSWSNKPIFQGVDGMVKLVKMPSTYQNGNLAAAFYVIAIPLTLSWQSKGKLQNIWRFMAIVLGLTGLLLSGARSAVFPFIPVWLAIGVIYIWRRRKPGMLYLLAVTAAVLLILVLMGGGKQSYSSPYQYMYSRYVKTSIDDPTASGRTVQASNLREETHNMSAFEKSRSVVLGISWENRPDIEGFLLLGVYFGFIAMLLFIILMLMVLYHVFKRLDPIIGLGLLAGFGQLLVDCAFAQPPTIINWFFVAGLAFNLAHTRRNSMVWKRGVLT